MLNEKVLFLVAEQGEGGGKGKREQYELGKMARDMWRQIED